jgi:hypothetical protein
MAITVPYIFVTATTASASEVNSNFSAVIAKALDKTGDTMTGTLVVPDVTVSSTLAVGTTSTFTGVATFTAKPVFTTPLTILGTIATGVWNAGAVTSTGAITTTLATGNAIVANTNKFVVAAATGNTTVGGTLTTVGGLHVGGTADAGVDNLWVDGSLLVDGTFGCNGKVAQSALSVGSALAVYGTGAYGLDSGANMSAMHAVVVAIRAALIANGIAVV